ncbi:TetR/AcrR family transcriptional regulator [Parafrankia sp. BMG5.11]|uniref:TetR/AcrR family transcriptional regulator n=1 Tax=Parafrankia sp. BMG5.11 TaxID=222540 RepID=UPI00103E3AE4|nr:TetR/AcrR family transcriptional regulator [Parafrankia sp. BMG5.11]TCJ35736.1 TetR/AcrR family transcriptional regulator [Parafrankia sp. BMG5.11]
MADQRTEGLRERKKRRTRQSIIDAAHELFHLKGYEAATVEEIADQAEVSVRTVFRYFTSKEAIALAPLDEMGDLTVAALRRRPADEPPLTALRNAAFDAWTLMSPDGDSLRHYADHLLLLDGSSPLAGAVLSRLVAIGDRLAVELAEETEPSPAEHATTEHATPEGTTAGNGPPDPGLGAQLTAVTFLGAVQVATRAWCSSGSTDLGDLLMTVDLCLGRLGVQPPTG